MQEKFTIYLRVSTKEQGNSGLGLKSQLEICQNHIKSVNGIMLKVFKDIESGTSRTRQGLWNAIDFCKQNNATLIIAKLDRLARDIEFTFHVINTGVNIFFVDMPIVNSMILGVFASVAQYERELISSRTKNALKILKENGKKLGREKGCDLSIATDAAAKAKKNQAANNENNIRFEKWLSHWENNHGEFDRYTDIAPLLTEVNALGYKTSQGLKFTAQSLRQMIYRTKNRQKELTYYN